MKIILVTIMLFLTTASYAGQRAITDTGEEVILNNDGTWTYSDAQKKGATVIESNSQRFTKTKSASFLLRSTKDNSAYWIDPDKWSFRKATLNEEAEYEFRLKGEDLYGMAISEGIEIPIESLTDIALSNAKNLAPDIALVKREYRVVNGTKLIHMQMRGTVQGIKITYFGYYHSDDSGSSQFIAWTGTSVVDKYRSEIFDFLNGYVTQ